MKRSRLLYYRGMIASVFVFSLLFLSSDKAFADATTNPLIQPSSLTYLGAFKLPTGTLGSTYGFGAAGTGGLGTYAITFNANRNSLFIGGHPYEQRVAEIAIPASLSGTPTATALSNLIDPVEGKLGSINPGDTNQKILGAALALGNALYVAGYSYYDGAVSQTKSYFSRPINLSTTGQVLGPAQVGSTYPGWIDRSATLIPSEWQTLLGGPALTGGGGGAINAVQSWGPSTAVFNPANITGTASIPAALVLGYPIGNPLNPATTGNALWSQCDVVPGQAFIASTRSVLFFGYHGMGDYCYGTGGSSGGDCHDPDNNSKGVHCYPYRSQVWAYDANDLVSVKNGTKQSYQVQPYSTWELDSSFKEIQGVGYDATSQKLYVSQVYADNTQPLIRVYQVNAAAPAPDLTPPTSPTSLSATSPSQSSITVSWTAATDNIAVTNYQVERCLGLSCSNFTQVGTPTTSPFTDTGLTASTGYSYHVRAVDAAGNVSGWSNVVGATTQAPDTTPPSTPTSLSATATSSSTIDLTWAASTDNPPTGGGVTGYQVERCSGASCTTFTQVGTPTTNSYQDTGLSASTTYRYQVRAVDAANNNSSYSSIAQASTPVAPPTPTFVAEYETAWNSATSPKTTSNFSVQTGDILVAYAVNESSGSTIDTPPTGTLTGTWTLKQTISATNYTYLRLWTMQVASNQTNVNVSFSNGSGNFGADVLHFRNASSVGITAQANANTGNPTLTLNGISDNSTIVMVNGDWSAKTGARTYNTTQAGAFTETSAYADGSSYGVEAGYYGNAGTAGNKTIGITAPTGMTWALAAIEVKGSGTGGSGDTTPPTSPTNLAASATSSSSVTVSWTAATDDVGVTGYQVERCSGTGCSTFTQVGTPTASPFVDSGLTASTFYNYHVRAVDAAGNVSGWSNVVGATTQSGSGGGTACNTVNVSSVPQLVNAVNAANSNPSCSTMILIADGTYTLSDMLPISAPNMTVKSQSENRDAVILQGDAMTSSASVKMIFRVDANNFTVENMTLQRVGWHLIQVVGENNRDNFIARNIVFRNAWEQMLKVTYVDTSSVGSDNGLVENSLFEFTSGQAGQYYTGGIDAHNAKNWVVRGNTFKNIISPSGSTAEHAIHFWSNSEDTLVEKNLIINCDRGIGFGLVQGRGHLRGIIRNNMIYHASGNGSFADVAIEADESPNTQIYNNTIFMQNSYANAIEYRWPLSSGIIIRNNLTNKAIQARDGATGTTSNNITNAQSTWFTNVSQGDLHLANGATSANNAGTSISGLTDDYDGNTRPQGGGIDVGADEYVSGGSSVSSCNTVTTTNFSQAAYNAYGAPFDAFQTSTNLLDAKCNSTDTHTINLTTGITGDTTRIVYTKGYYYDLVTTGWTQYSGTCNGALNGEWCQGSISATITNPNISTASASNPTYLVGMTCSVQGGGWKCGCRDTTCSNFYWQVQGAGQ